jgi:hypothetical protein
MLVGLKRDFLIGEKVCKKVDAGKIKEASTINEK